MNKKGDFEFWSESGEGHERGRREKSESGNDAIMFLLNKVIEN